MKKLCDVIHAGARGSLYVVVQTFCGEIHQGAKVTLFVFGLQFGYLGNQSVA
jgi:hypothetical protein